MDNFYNEPNKEQNNEYTYGESESTYTEAEVLPTYNPNPNPNGGPTPVYTDVAQPKTGLAVAALVLGIIAIVTSCFGFNIIIGIIGIIFAAVYLSKKQPARRGMAIAGLVLSIISIAVFVIMVILVVAFTLSGAFGMFMSDPMYQEMYNEIMMEMY